MTLSLALQILGTSCGILGALLTAYKRRECWIAFTVSGLAMVAVLLMAGIYVPILQYAVFLSINVLGWFKWKRPKDKHS